MELLNAQEPSSIPHNKSFMSVTILSYPAIFTPQTFSILEEAMWISGFLSPAGHKLHHQWITPSPGAHNDLVYSPCAPDNPT